MTEKHIAYYLSSKIAAALINLSALALFVRIAGTEIYAAYLIMFAWAYIVYGFTIQWLKFSFFACYQRDGGKDLVSTFFVVVAVGLTAIMAIIFLGYVLGVESAEFGLGLAALISGLSIYDALQELARIRLHSGVVAISILGRAVLMLVLGVLSLFVSGTALGLAVAIGLAHLGAAIPLLIDGRDKIGARFSSEAAHALWRYGRPMVPAFMLSSTGSQLDRLLLARFYPLSIVGAYGVAMDFVRQTMVVISEAIAGAYISVARAELADGRVDKAIVALSQAFLAYTALTTFVVAFMLRFDQLIFGLLFGKEVASVIAPALTLILVANAIGIYRAYYFEQASYLTENAHMRLIADCIAFAVLSVTALLLIPPYEIAGAALAILLGHIAGCLAYVIAWRRRFMLSLPFGRAILVAAIALATYSITGLVGYLGEEGWLTTIANLGLFAVAIVGVARAFNILSFNDLTSSAIQLVRRKISEQQNSKAS